VVGPIIIGKDVAVSTAVSIVDGNRATISARIGKDRPVRRVGIVDDRRANGQRRRSRCNRDCLGIKGEKASGDLFFCSVSFIPAGFPAVFLRPVALILRTEGQPWTSLGCTNFLKYNLKSIPCFIL
jgi:hypothetical protein